MGTPFTEKVPPTGDPISVTGVALAHTEVGIVKSTTGRGLTTTVTFDVPVQPCGEVATTSYSVVCDGDTVILSPVIAAPPEVADHT